MRSIVGLEATGKELFFLSLDTSIMAVSVRDAGETLDLGVPVPLATAGQTRVVVQAPDYDDWDVSADGQRFLVKQPAGADEPAKIHVLVDWASDPTD